jgi:hypothetical protein
VVFSKKELGDGGLRFLARMRESQMFCNYCHAQSLKRRAHRQHGDRRTTPSMSRSRSDLENLNLNYHDDVVQGNAVVERCRSGESGLRSSGRYPLNNDMKSVTISEKSYSGQGQGTGLDDDKEKDDEDCLVTLFKIMLTGTIPMKQNRLNELISSYERDENRLKNENFKSTSSAPTPLPITSYFSPILPSSPVSISYKHTSSEKYEYRSSKSLGDSKKEVLLEDGIVWCNGRCNGAANGPFCSSICLKIWDERVLQAKKILGLKQAIARQHHSGTVISN